MYTLMMRRIFWFSLSIPARISFIESSSEAFSCKEQARFRESQVKNLSCLALT
jgi:hypothetical protein